MKVFIDTNIPMYAAGKDHPFKNKCLGILESIATEGIEAHTDTEVLQEILYRYYYINQRETGFAIFDLFATIMDKQILPVRHGDMTLARLLAEKEETLKLSPRDLIHLAVMLNNDIRHIVTTDRGFTGIPGIEVITP
jgi:predicted nucleic acid-binding protein